MKISIVIPTYNRHEQLSEVLDYIFQSEVEGFSDIEIIVVDDGSPIPARSVIESKKCVSPFELKYLRQPNAGPAKARNNGFHAARNAVVLFIDDDILVFPDLIKKHAEAHRLYPESVICGQSPYFPSDRLTPAYRYLTKLFDENFDFVAANQSNNFAKIEMVASGNLSVEKTIFDRRDVYGENLTIPASEEFELSYYLRQKKIAVYSGLEIKGWHLQPATIKDSCQQNYKYGLGISELAQKQPNVMTLRQLREIFRVNRPIQKQDAVKLMIKKSIRKMLAGRFAREKMLVFVKILEKLNLNDKILFTFYKLIVGNYFAAGIRDGIQKFAGEKQ